MKKAKTFKPKIGTGKKFVKKRMYDTLDWTEYRNKFLQANPKCYCCSERAVVVDHIIPHKGDEKKFWESTNFIPLCKKDHDKITGLFDRHVVPKTEEKMLWINARRMETGTATRVRVVSVKRDTEIP